MLTELRFPTYHEIVPSFLVLPMISHWILPAGIEMNLYTSILSVPFYLPNLFYLIYILSYPCIKEEMFGSIFSRYWVLVCCFLFWITYTLTTLLNYAEPLLPIIFNAYPIVWLAPIMLLWPLSGRQLQSTKYIMVFALLFICAEIFLYATGILTYRSESTGVLLKGQEYAGGIMRISTTIGAATGTSVIVAWLGILCFSLYDFPSPVKWSLLVISIIAVFYTVSRGSIVVIAMYTMYYVYTNYLKGSSLKVKIASIAVTFAIIAGLYNISVFDAIKDRNEQLKKNVYTGRDRHIENSLKIIEDSKGLGVGAAMMFPEKSIQKAVVPSKREASHNVLLIVAGETGIVGLFSFLGIILLMLFNADRNHSLYVFLWLALLINFNTEGVISMSEFIALYLFMLMSIQNKIQ